MGTMPALGGYLECVSMRTSLKRGAGRLHGGMPQRHAHFDGRNCWIHAHG